MSIMIFSIAITNILVRKGLAGWLLLLAEDEQNGSLVNQSRW